MSRKLQKRLAIALQLFGALVFVVTPTLFQADLARVIPQTVKDQLDSLPMGISQNFSDPHAISSRVVTLSSDELETHRNSPVFRVALPTRQVRLEIARVSKMKSNRDYQLVRDLPAEATSKISPRPASEQSEKSTPVRLRFTESKWTTDYFELLEGVNSFEIFDLSDQPLGLRFEMVGPQED
jgi:hypothetical protein